MADAIIIGAGYAGMSAAALLAHSGRKVIVLEASGMIGGRALSYKNEKGYVWEYGTHSHRLGHKGIANDIFKRLGEEIDFLPEAKDAKLAELEANYEALSEAYGYNVEIPQQVLLRSASRNAMQGYGVEALELVQRAVEERRAM